MVAIVEPGRWEAVRAVCERWDLPVAVIGRVTEEQDIVVLTAPDGVGRPDRTAAGRRCRELARIPARALASRGDRVRARVTRRPPAVAPRPPRAPPTEQVDTLPLRGQDPGAVLTALLGSANLSSRREVFEQYDWNVQSNTVAGPGPRRGGPADQGDDEGARRDDRRQRPRRPARPVARRRDVRRGGRPQRSITGARPLGVTNCLNFGDPTRPEAFWQLAEAVRGLSRRVHRPRAAGHRRQRLAVQRGAGLARSPRRRRSASSGCSTTSRRGSARRSARRATRSLLVGDTAPGLAGSAYERLAGAAPEDGPPPLDLARETAVQAFIREAIARGLVESCQDVSGGGLAVAVAEMCIWGDVGRDAPRRRRRLAGRRPVRREPVAARRRGRARATCRPSSCSPATTGCRSTRSAPRAARASSSSSRATARPAPPRSGAPASRTRWRSRVTDLRHAWDHGLPRALGWEGDGAADHAAEAALPGVEVSG